MSGCWRQASENREPGCGRTLGGRSGGGGIASNH